MKNTAVLRKISFSCGAFLAASLILTGCSINVGNLTNSETVGAHDMMHDSEAGFSANDVMFAQMMITHHQQAVDMGTLAETRALSPEVKTLASQIKAEQAPEIELMKSWLTASHSSFDMGHDMAMPGLLDDAHITALEGATGSAFDNLYLEGMIAHHEGAISMANSVIDSSNADVRKLANSIIASQGDQIAYMKSLLK